jgi:hypothetical protein
MVFDIKNYFENSNTTLFKCLAPCSFTKLSNFSKIKLILYPSPEFFTTSITMTKGWGATLTPEQGCVSSIKCLFEPVTSGAYYGSDGLRSPLILTRDPGSPEYEGEENPDPARYTKSNL